MIHFTALGDVDLRTDDGNVVGSVLSQPRRLALLAYLAIESARGGIPRDRLIGVFWPDLPQEQGRQALRTALHFLRRSLGADTFGGHGTWIAVNPAAVRCDAAELRAKVAEGDAEGALRLYRGDLLPGFHLDGGPVEFEHWLDATREGLRRSAAEAAWTLAAQAQASGNPAGAGAWARRAAALYEGDEAAARRSIELLGEVGDRAGALDVYDSLARHLRDEFDAEPSARTRAAIAAVRGEDTGETWEESAAAAPVDGGGLVLAPRARPTRRIRQVGRAGYSAAVTVLLAFGFYSLWGANRGSRVGERYDDGQGLLVQVEELRDLSSDPAMASLAAALTFELTGRLSESEALQVVPVTVAAAPSAQVRGRNGYVVHGGVLRSDSTARITIILLDGASGATLDRVGLERRIETFDVDEMAEILARRIRREVSRAVDDHERSLTSRNPQALALVRAAVRDMEVADSGATAGVAEPARLAFEAADSQLALAQAAAPRWAEPSVLRAEVSYRRMWLDLLPPINDPRSVARVLQAGIGHAGAALAIAPDEPAALELRGILQYWVWLTRSGGSATADREALRRAEADLRAATALDAGRGRAWTTLSALLESRADFAAANLAAARAYRADPHLHYASETLLRLFTTSLEVGDVAAARKWCDEIERRPRGPWLPGYCRLMQLAWHGVPGGIEADSLEVVIASALDAAIESAQVQPRLQMLGAVALARTGSPRAQAMMETARATVSGDPELAVLEAWAHVVMGDSESAIALLAAAAKQNPRGAPSMLRSRRFETLRSDPRLQSLVLANSR